MVGPWARRVALLALLLGAVLPASPARAQEAGAGSLRGSVTDKDFQVPIPGVRLTLVEARRAAVSNGQGQFVFESVPAGTYTLTADKDGYERKIVAGVVVAPGRLSDLRVELASEVVEMEELVITGADLLVERRGRHPRGPRGGDGHAGRDLRRPDQRAGASDVAGALKIVVGASVAEGKYATVRGLSDRYTGTTLNGVPGAERGPAPACRADGPLPDGHDRQRHGHQDLHARPAG